MTSCPLQKPISIQVPKAYVESHILTGGQERFRRIEYDNIERDVNDSRVLKTRIGQANQMVIQWAFGTQSKWAEMRDQVKLHIHLYKHTSH
ncbi:hypothetical protein N7488_001192 [Penicillium malachiteum]|nr:hypothetical protein N7488_001192 [Penicillium malachiteum]